MAFGCFYHFKVILKSGSQSCFLRIRVQLFFAMRIRICSGKRLLDPKVNFFRKLIFFNSKVESFERKKFFLSQIPMNLHKTIEFPDPHQHDA